MNNGNGTYIKGINIISASKKLIRYITIAYENYADAAGIAFNAQKKEKNLLLKRFLIDRLCAMIEPY
jgi:hypothetical protein